ncbi:hypothetical protein [Variovorax sp. DT-64]|uniref:hypothetical protein n=1 Tax=Variovorax sp. DT-64 TaxID=3396160 RepID=UPI003F1CC3A6
MIEFERQIQSGQIDCELFERMKEAEQYGAASSMQWLISVLARLKILIAAGVIVRFDLGKEICALDSFDGLKEFCEKYFPDAAKSLKQ